MGAESAGEDLAVVGEDFPRGAIEGPGLSEDAAHAGGLGPLDEPSGHIEPGVVVDAGHGLEFRPSASQIPPMISICHSCIGRGRSQRR
jgi:hypothetical protein